MDEDGDVGDPVRGDRVITLEEAVADFDVALRDHRNKRRGLGSTLVGVVDLPDNANKYPGSGVGSPLHNTEASNWLDGEAMSWATVDLGIATDPREWSPGRNQENELPNEAGNNISRDNTTLLTAPGTRSVPVPHTPPTLDDGSVSERIPQPDNTTQVVHDEELGRTPECSSALKNPLSPEGVECLAKDGDAPILSGALAVVRDPGGTRPSSPSLSAETGSPRTRAGATVAEEAARPGELPSTEPSSLLPSSPSTTERAMTARIGSIAEEKIVEARADAKGDPLIRTITDAAAADRVGGITGWDATQDNSFDSPTAAPVTSISYETGVLPKAAVGNISVSVPSSKTPGAVVPGTAPADTNTVPGAATAATVIAPQTSLAMECPDPVATVEQQTAGNWMEGIDCSSSQQRLPAPLAIAEAEAKLAEKVDRLQSKRLAAEREEREALDERRATKFAQECAVRAEGFAEEDRKTLAAEERRLAELRRKADLGRLQRGAEFQEADEALGVKVAPSATTTGATPMPVRGMRPQHFGEQEDLPAGIKKSLDRRADKVLDEMEGLEARAKAAGGGMNLEAFEKVEQRQRARQVERMEILHGQTAEEKSTTMLMMAVRLQMFARQRVARIRVARVKQARSASKGRVSFCSFASVSVAWCLVGAGLAEL